MSCQDRLLLSSLGIYSDGQLDDAVNTYRHYRHNTGTDYEVDYNEAYHEDANIRSVVDRKIARAQSAAEILSAKTGKSTFSMTGRRTLAQ